MTTQGQPANANDTIRRLRRRTSDRVIGGVAGGLGDYLNVDPLLIRIGFAGLMVFGGAGLVLYVIAWILIPAEGSDESSVERLLRRIGLRTIGWVALAFVLVFLFVWMPEYGPPLGYFPTWFWALVVLVIGVLVLRRESPPRVSAASVQVPASSVVQPAMTQPRPTPKPRGPLGWYTLAALLIAVGVLASVANVVALDVDLGQYFGVALLLLGFGLVVGAWWGNGRLLILLGILLLPLAAAASFITAPLEGGFADTTFNPSSVAELRPEYRLTGGRLALDLTELPASAEPIRIAASVAVGQLTVIVPQNASVDAQVAVGGGAVGFLDEPWLGGTRLTNHYVREGPGPEIVLALEAGMGEIRVASPDSRGRCIGCDCAWWTSCGYELIPEEGSELGPEGY